VLVVTTDGRGGFGFGANLNPDPDFLNVGSGRIREKKSLETLARNGFFSVEQGQGEMRITLGEKGRQLLREVDEKAKATTAS
jgi:hypothetical protein